MKDTEFKRKEKITDDNISKIFNPENKYKRTQKEILKNIFG
jgi:hypothetical protein